MYENKLNKLTFLNYGHANKQKNIRRKENKLCNHTNYDMEFDFATYL